MKKELLITFAAFFLLSLTALTGVYAGGSKEEIITISRSKVDLTGDRKEDIVSLMGSPFEMSGQFIEKIFVKVDATNKKTYKIALDGGYEPEGSFHDLNHDGVKDLLLRIVTGDRGGLSNFYLYSLKDFKLTDLSVPEPLTIASQFEDGYKASIAIGETGQSYTFNLNDRKEDYARIGLYRDGKLNEPTELIIEPFGELKPTKMKGNLIGLTGSQKISGAYHSDPIATIESTWFYEKGKWKLNDTKVKN